MTSPGHATGSVTDLPNRLLVLLTVGLLCAINVRGGGAVALLVLILLLPLAVGWGNFYTIHLVLVFAASYLVFQFIPASTPLLTSKLIGIVLYFYVAVMLVPLRRSLDWLRLGNFSRRSAVLLITVIAGSAVALALWGYRSNQNPTMYDRLLPPDVPSHFVALYVVAFAMINALIEEIIWRGVMLTALDAAFGAGLLALLLQSAHFGFAHYHGAFPNGWSGVLLTALFGAVMGLLRRRSNGLLVPWCAHVAADVVILCLVILAKR